VSASRDEAGPYVSRERPAEALARALYSLAWLLATPLAIAYLLWRSRAQPEYRRHWRERWGLVAARRDDRPLVWVHAVSVGETRAAQPLVAALLARDPSTRVLLTHATPTGRETGALLFAAHAQRVVQAYLPYDGARAPGRFLAAWRPCLGVLMETEVWPNLSAACRRAGVPLALVNARLSERSLRKGTRWGVLIRPALRSLACVVAQGAADAERLARLGRENTTVAGNLKFDVTPPEPALALGRAWRARLAGRPVVLAASTRDGEEALLLDAWRAHAGRLGGALLAIVPRHPQRFDEVAALVAARGFALARRDDLGPRDDAAPAATKRDELPRGAESAPRDADPRPGGVDPAGADVVLGDSMGEMFAYYAMADVAIIGGSLLPFGGQNLIEACAAGVPVVVGPHTFNFADAAALAVEAGAATRVADADAAVGRALELVADEGARAQAAARAAQFARLHRGATARTLAALEAWLPAVGPRGG